jgi:hypothetical protein
VTIFETRVTEPNRGPVLAGETAERRAVIGGLIGLCDAARTEPDAQKAAAMRRDADALVSALNADGDETRERAALTLDAARRQLAARTR